MHARSLERLVRVFSALVPPLAGGCGPDAIDETQFSEDLCGDEGFRILDAIEPADSVDYVEARNVYSMGTFEMPIWSEPTVWDQAGERCAGASDPAACEAAFAGLPVESEFIVAGFEGESRRSLAYTRADDAAAILSPTALREFLGEIDASGDAAILAVMEGHGLVCGDGDDVGPDGDGWVLYTSSGGGCGEGDDVEEHVVFVGRDGRIEVIQTVLIEKGDPNCAVGRLPAGLCRRARARSVGPVGAFFADVAHLEAASVTAFAQLARELTLHGAPRAFVASALRSRQDEIRHARATARLAHRYGARPTTPRVAGFTPRSLADVAIDNVAEGCIRETYGALVAHVQARTAADPVVRRALAAIARDETRHAALSLSLAQWADARMSRAERTRVARGTADALDRLEADLTSEHAEAVHVRAGMPRPDRARALYGALRTSLFAA